LETNLVKVGLNLALGRSIAWVILSSPVIDNDESENDL